MRVGGSLILLFAVAMAAAGCARQPVVQYQMVAAPGPQMASQMAPQAGPQGIDNVIYGSAQTYRPVVAQPAYRSAPPPTYAMGAPAYPAYATAPPAYRIAPTPVAMVPRYATAGPVAYAPSAQPSYTLDSGDRLRIVVFGQDGLTNSYVLDASGSIAMPLIGTVSARGLTTDQLSERIGGLLRNGFIREPHVAVEVESYRPFFILGEVTQPGQYPYVANMTVETAVAIAGGFGPRALHSPVTVSRNIGGQVMRYQSPLTAQIQPGDTVHVKERWF